MAARESQGLQIALILFVMLTVALAVTTYLYFRKAEEQIAARKAAEGQRDEERRHREELQLQAQRFKEMLGYDIAESMETIEENFTTDMQILPGDLPEQEKHYRMMPQALIAFVNQQHSLMQQKIRDERKYISEKQAAEAQRDQQVADARKAQQAAASDLDQERQKFNEERNRYKTQTAKYAQELQNKNKEYATLEATSRKKVEEMAERVTRLSGLVAGKDEIIQGITQEKFDHPDGKITWVNQNADLVWVDVGSDDYVPRQATFSVYDKESQDQIKGSIEITKIIDDRLSEARIVDHQLGNPILPGDLIYTPTWHPGSQVHFALVGILDVDGDGIDDTQLVRNLITMNGGVVDAVEEEGRIQGEMDVNTRYIVMGERPTEASAAESIKAYTEMLKLADDLGVEKLPLKKLLAQMGYRGGTRTVTLGRGANPEDFPSQPGGGVNRQSTGATSFDQRRPPARGAAGAF